MPEAKRWRKKVILLKIESAYGTDPTPTGGANALLMTNVEFRPMEGEEVPRNLERPYLGAQEKLKGGLRATLVGSTELVGSGTAGTAPAWGVLARVCGLAETIVADTSVAYNPVSASFESGTIYFYLDGTRQILKGARGTGVLTVNAQGIPSIRWTLQGLWTLPTDTALAAPTLTAWKKPVLATNVNTPVFTLGGVSLVMRSTELDFGVDVQPRLLVGREEMAIVDRSERITVRCEAVPLATFDPFTAARDNVSKVLALTHGVTAGYITSLACSACVLGMPSYTEEQGVQEWTLPMEPVPSSGNDQYSITLT